MAFISKYMKTRTAYNSELVHVVPIREYNLHSNYSCSHRSQIGTLQGLSKKLLGKK